MTKSKWCCFSLFFYAHNTVDISETCVSIGKLFQTKMEELEMEIVNIQSDLMLQYADEEKSFNFVCINEYLLLRISAPKIKV